MDFQKLIEQFKNTDGITFLELLETNYVTPDEIVYTIKTNTGIFYIYEVDYIGDFNIDVLDVVRKAVGEYHDIYEVKKEKILEDSTPYKSANVYAKVAQWEMLTKYSNDKYGSAPYYFNFLFKK